MANEMKSLTLNGKTYDSFPDEQARTALEQKQPKGDYVKSVNGASPDENGNVEIDIPDSVQGAVLYTEQELTEEQQEQARKNIGVIGSSEVFNSILELLRCAVYGTDVSASLDKLETLIRAGKPVYKWVIGLNGSYVSGTNEALLVQNERYRAICVATGTGIPMTYGSNYQPTEMSPYSPVVIPDGAVSVTVRCPGFYISFNELKLVDGKWYRLFGSDTDPAAGADEVTYTFRKAEAAGLYIKLRHPDNSIISDVPDIPDITFNYEPEPEPEPEGDGTYKWIVGLNGSGDANGVATLTQPNPARAMALAENKGVPLYYGGSGNAVTTISPYSPVVIPEGAVSVTVKCPGFRISFNELKLIDSTWYRQFTSDSSAFADEATYTFTSAESTGLYIKLRHLTEDWTDLTDVPESVDITFNY